LLESPFHHVKKPKKIKKIETENPNGKTIQDLNVPNGFVYKTVKNITLDLSAKDATGLSYKGLRFQVFTGYPDSTGSLIVSGAPDQQGRLVREVTIPIIIDSLYVSSNYAGIGGFMMPITGNTLQYSYQNTPPLQLKSDGNSFFPDVFSDFSTGKEGWTAYRDNGTYACMLSSATNTPLDAGPDGPGDPFLWGFDTQGGARSFKAPDTYHGNIYGKYISYDYYLGNMLRTFPMSTVAEIRLTNGSQVLSVLLDAVFPHEVNGGWQTKYIKLDETDPGGSGWRIGNMGTWTTGNGGNTLGRNPATTTQIQQILSNVTGVLIAPERQNGQYSGNGPEFIAIDNVSLVNSLSSITIYTQGGNNNDQDGDGVPDDSDDYPEDPDRAFNNYAPGETSYGTLAFEDLWPGTGDYDFNDLVLDYRYNVVTNASNLAVEVKTEFVVQAIGAGMENGFGFMLDIQPGSVASVTGSEYFDSYLSIGANGTENQQSDAVIIPTDNVSSFMGVQTSFMNTEIGAPYITPDTIRNVVLFASPVAPATLGEAPYNLFLITNKTRGNEIHLPGSVPTDLANTSLFGTGMDDSNPASGKYYQTANNLPWAIHLPVSFAYPIEQQEIVSAYLKFAPWAESGGSSFTDWYEDNSGYRNDALIYSQ
jgi:LruC domain-containing protein